MTKSNNEWVPEAMDFFKELKSDKIKINWNKNPIPMDLFKSFLTVEVSFVEKHLGSDTGWTMYVGDDDLVIKGGRFREGEFLDSLQYKKNLNNPYNNFVNPFYLFEIMSDEGKKFFINYYREDIEALKLNREQEIVFLKNKLNRLKSENKEINLFWAEMEVLP